MRTIENETLVLDAKNINEQSRETHFVNCHITFTCAAKDLLLWRAKFEGCSLVFTKKIVKNYFDNVAFINCTFEGTFDDCIFGTDKGSADYPFFAMENCDLSKTKIMSCRFVNVNPAGMVLPKWPYFSILYPNKNGEALLAEDWPGEDLLINMETNADEDEETTFVTDEANDLLKTTDDLTVEELKEKLNKFDFVVM